MKKFNLFTALAIQAVIWVCAHYSPAQTVLTEQGAGSGGGGSFTEIQLKTFLGRLEIYLGSSEGQKDFPEVFAYDQAHPNETIEMIAMELNPHLIDGTVWDRFGNERDCVGSYQNGKRSFTCNLNHLPALPAGDAENEVKSEYYGDMYRLVLHETLVQAGLEDQMANEVPSNYPIASRLKVHFELEPVWMPGSAKLTSQKRALQCFIRGDGPMYMVEEPIDNTVDHGMGGMWKKLKTKKKEFNVVYSQSVGTGFGEDSFHGSLMELMIIDESMIHDLKESFRAFREHDNMHANVTASSRSYNSLYGEIVKDGINLQCKVVNK
jgi:hypothetical protein